MDNILVELERIDHIAESEAAKSHSDELIPLEVPAKPEIADLMAIEVLDKPEIESLMMTEVQVKPEIENLMPIEVSDKSLAEKDSNATPIETSIEQVASTSSEVAEKSADILNDLPSYLSQLYQNNQGAFITVGLFLGTLVAFKILLAILGAVNSIPLFAPFFQSIGFGYTAWFVYRYLLKASTREELGEKINTLKSQVAGK